MERCVFFDFWRPFGYFSVLCLCFFHFCCRFYTLCTFAFLHSPFCPFDLCSASLSLYLFIYIGPLGQSTVLPGRQKPKCHSRRQRKSQDPAAPAGRQMQGSGTKRLSVKGKARCPGRYRPADRILHSDLLKRPARSIRPVILRDFALFPRFLLTLAPLRVILLTDSGLF